MLQKQLCREHKLCGPSFKLIYKTITDIIFLYYYYIGANHDHSSIHMVDNLVGDSILIKTRACGVPISPNAPCLLILNQINKRQRYYRLRSKSNWYRSRRVNLRRQHYILYDTTRNESYYCKEQLDPK